MKFDFEKFISIAKQTNVCSFVQIATENYILRKGTLITNRM